MLRRRTGAILALSLTLNALAGLYLVKAYPWASARWRALTQTRTARSPRVSRTDMLNGLISKFKYDSYLEIGQGYREANFDLVSSRVKLGVDPDRALNAAFQMTSDEFFARNHDTFDLVFVDGLHEADQAERDILSALKVLNDGGTIVVHDCNPQSEETQIVPRRADYWTGDVWKAWVRLRASRADLEMFVVDTESGVGVIRRGTQQTIQLPQPLDYKALEKDRGRLLNLVGTDVFLERLKRGFTAGDGQGR